MTNRDLQQIINSLREDPSFPTILLDLIETYKPDLHRVEEATNPNITSIILAVDESGSMEDLKPTVISGYNHMLNALSVASAKNDIYLGQITFNDDITVFQPLTKLRSTKGSISGNVLLLNDQNYRPEGYTALYDAILYAIINITPMISYYLETGNQSFRRICVLTDGVDYGEVNGQRAIDGGSKSISKQDLAVLVKDLLDNQFIHQIILAGIGNHGYRQIGVDLNIPDPDIIEIAHLTDKEVRKVFSLFSSIPE